MNVVKRQGTLKTNDLKKFMKTYTSKLPYKRVLQLLSAHSHIRSYTDIVVYSTNSLNSPSQNENSLQNYELLFYSMDFIYW
jgi:hypothetical protein